MLANLVRCEKERFASKLAPAIGDPSGVCNDGVKLSVSDRAQVMNRWLIVHQGPARELLDNEPKRKRLHRSSLPGRRIGTWYQPLAQRARRQPAGADPYGLCLVDRDALHAAVHDPMDVVPAGVAHSHSRLAGGAVVDVDRLLAVLVEVVAGVVQKLASSPNRSRRFAQRQIPVSQHSRSTAFRPFIFLFPHCTLRPSGAAPERPRQRRPEYNR